MSLLDIKKELKNLDQNELIELVLALGKNYKQAKEYLEFFANPDQPKWLAEYKERLYLCFFPKLGWKCKTSKAKKELSAFKSLGVSDDYYAYLLLCYVEFGLEYAYRWGVLAENFHTSLFKIMGQSLQILKKENALLEFKNRYVLLIILAEKIFGPIGDAYRTQIKSYYPD
jgi:hypothetical protein